MLRVLLSFKTTQCTAVNISSRGINNNFGKNRETDKKLAPTTKKNIYPEFNQNIALTFFFYQRLGDWYALYHPEQGKTEKHENQRNVI